MGAISEVPAPPSEHELTEPAFDDATDLLVEEVSIDGLCGVY